MWATAQCFPSYWSKSRPRNPPALSRPRGAYDTRACQAAFAARKATPAILTRRNGRLWKESTPGARARNEILWTSRRLDRAIWRNWSGYRQRCRVEAKMRCLKLFGERLTARTSNRQNVKLQIRAACPAASPPSVRLKQCTPHKRHGIGESSPSGRILQQSPVGDGPAAPLRRARPALGLPAQCQRAWRARPRLRPEVG